jgi:hypothetical protein
MWHPPTEKIVTTATDTKTVSPSATTLPELFTTDSSGKTRTWKCWVEGNTVYRQHGLVDGKKVDSKRVFLGKSIGKKNETTPEEQAWAEANREWVKHIDKEYLPADDDKAGQSLLSKVKVAQKKTGGHNINAGAAAGARGEKEISRKKSSTCMVETIEGGPVIPMKAQVWELENEKDPYSVKQKVEKYFSKTTGRGKTLKLESTPFYGQAKLDGWRARVMIQRRGADSGEWEVVITSNSGKQYPWFQTLREAVIEWLTSDGIDHADLLDGLDGEMFALQLYNDDGSFVPQSALFSTICSICGLARSAPHELEDQMQFHIFDLLDKSGTLSQVERFERLDRLFAKMPESVKPRIERVPTEILNSVEEVPDFHDKFAEMGYEGVVLRTFDMTYVTGKRNAKMRKFKHFIDEEYEITGTKLDPGVDKEQFVWLLKTEDGKKFNAKPMGTKEEKLVWYENRKDYTGRFLTVKFQQYLEDGVPRFPIAKAFREGKGIDG